MISQVFFVQVNPHKDVFFKVITGEIESLRTINKNNNNNNNARFNAIIPAGRVSNFCSNSLSSFLLIVRILSSLAISFQILLYALFPRFPWSIFLPFPSYFNFHNLTYLGTDVSTHDMTIPLQTALNYDTLNLHNNTHPITKNISRHPINQSHPTHYPDHTTLPPHNLASSTTVSSRVSQHYNKTGQ